MGLELEIAGSELTNQQAAGVLGEVLGRPVEFQAVPVPPMKEFQQMFRWINDSGFQANIGALRERYPEVQLKTLEQWLYSRRLAQARAAVPASAGMNFSLEGAFMKAKKENL